MPTHPQHPLTTIDKAAVLLAQLDNGTGPAGVSDLARATGLPKTTVHRLLAILERNGAIERTGHRYAIVGTINPSAVRTRRLAQLAAIARPFLVDLYARSGFAAHLAARSGTHAIIVDSVYPASWIETALRSSTVVDPHCAASGKVLLAYDPGFARRHLSRGPLTAVTTRTITDPARLGAELVVIRRRGFAIEQHERVVGSGAVAVPLLTSGAVFGSVELAGATARLDTAQVMPLLVRTGNDITAAIRRHGPAV